MQVHAVNRSPRVICVSAPEQSDDTRAEVARQRDRIAMMPDAFNGPKLLTLTAGPDDITVYHADYATRLAHSVLQNTEGTSPLGLGSLAVAVLLDDGGHAVLLARRSQTVAVYPGCWGFSANGGVDPGQTPDAAACAELQEELGVCMQGAQLRCVALAVGPDPTGCLLIYRASIARDEQLHPNADEVAALRWFDWSQSLPTNMPAPTRQLLVALRRRPISGVRARVITVAERN